MSSLGDAIAAHYAEAPPAPTPKQRATAHGWAYDADAEALIANPDVAARVFATDRDARMRLGLYRDAKAAAEACGIDTSRPDAA